MTVCRRTPSWCEWMRVSSRSSTSVILGSEGSLGASRASALRSARGPRLGPGEPCPEVESRGFVFELKNPILGNENLRRGCVGVFLVGLALCGRGEAASTGGARAPGETGIGLPNAFSASERGAKVACRANMPRWLSGEGGSWSTSTFPGAGCTANRLLPVFNVGVTRPESSLGANTVTAMVVGSLFLD